MGTSDTLRSVIDAGRSSKRLDELSSARVIGKIALQIHAAQQKAGAGKAVGPVTPTAITFAPTGDVKLSHVEGSALGYSAPEQLTGTGDRRSDVFSLGAVLWEALTHQRLFDAMNDAAVRVAVQDRPIQAPAEVNANIPAELSAICMRALARNPADRYQSLKSMAVEIEEFLSEAGYEDNDDKIAQYLESMSKAKAVKIEMPSMPRPAGGTQPPPTGGPLRAAAASQPPANRPASASQAPSILTSPPSNEPRPKSNSGAALAAALANAGSSQTALGVPSAPVASEWQDKSAPPAHAAAPVTPAMAPAAPATSILEPAVPLTPLPPVLPGQTPVRNDKSTISVSVPPQVKVATNAAVIEAKHAEPKPPALIVDEKPKALIVEDEPKPAATKEAKKETSPGTGMALKEPAKDTLPDGKLPAAALEEKLAVAEAKIATAAETKPVSALEAPPVKQAVAKAETKPDAKIVAKPEAKTEAKPTRAPSESEATRKRSPSESEATRKRSPSQDGSRKRSPSQGGTGPNPVAAVSLGPGRDSKGDLLAGWGWGTDKHDAIAPDGYVDHDEPFDAEHAARSRKTLMYMIGGGVAFAAMVTIVALLSGGSKGKKKEKAKPVAAARESEATAPTPTPDPLPPTPTGTGGSAAPTNDTAGSAAAGSAVVDQAAAGKAAADKAAADKAAADQAAADQAAADKAAADKAAADKAAADKADKQTAADKAAADKAAAEADKKAAAAQAAADKKAAAEAEKKAAAEKKALAEADRKAAAEKAAADRKAAAEKLAAERKAAAEKLAAERKAAAEKAAAARANEPKTKTETRPKDAKAKGDTKIAKADTKTEGASKADVETAYRQGLQQFARGDTAGALASLRVSLAGNPNYAPTWRGLGLVFEKMGEKEQARAAYKRYLQLSPSASDAEQIKGRLERLGT